MSQKKWVFFEEEDCASSDSSVPDNLNLIDGEIEIIQRSKALTDEDKISPGTTLHRIKMNDRDRRILATSGSVSTDWTIELESSFFRGSQLLVRQVSPGSTFSHCYDNQGAFDRVMIRAHLTAESGSTVFDGYYCRRQKLANPLEGLHAMKKLDGVRQRKLFNKLRDAIANPVNDQLNASGDCTKSSRILPQHSNSMKEKPFQSNTRFPDERFPGLLSSFGDNEPIKIGGEMKTFNEGSKVKKPEEWVSSARTVSKTTNEASVDRKTQKVDLPDPKNVPKAVLDVRNFEDVLANKKVIDYLSRLEDGAGVINSHLKNIIEVSQEDIKLLGSATSAILQEYGYGLSESPRVKNYSRSYTSKMRDPRGETESSSGGSDVSDSELKSEVVKRAIEGRDFSELLGSLKNSKEWKESEKDDFIPGSCETGKIERKLREYRNSYSSP